MNVIRFESQYFNQVAELLSLFRVKLNSFKGINNEPNIISAKEELNSFLTDEHYPIYLCIKDNEVAGYMILKIDGVIWIEQLYVKENYRRKGIGSLLFEEAEKISHDLGEETLFNYVHPNNDTMINFLRSKGYTVLNLLEIRKPYKDEKTNKKYKIGNNDFDY